MNYKLGGQMAFATKLTQSVDKNGNTYFWGYLKVGMVSMKVTMFPNKKEPETWNLNLDQQQEDRKPKGVPIKEQKTDVVLNDGYHMEGLF